MGAKVRIWQVTDNLRDRNDDNKSEASFVGTLLHEEILETAAKAVSRLRARPNPRLLKLLIAHLEAYPYGWSQEGYEDLLPNLKKLQNTRKSEREKSRLTRGATGEQAPAPEADLAFFRVT
jgi:hypothetical protein